VFRVISETNKPRHRERIVGSLVAGLTLLCLCIGIFTPTAYASGADATATATPVLQPGVVTLPIQQTFTGDTPSDPQALALTYELTPQQASDPMPAGSSASVYTFTLTGTQTMQIDPIDFTKAGVYTYQLKCTTPGTKELTPDPQVYTIDIYIQYNLTPTIVASLSNGDKAPDLGFTPSYSTGTVVSPGKLIDVEGTKTWDYGNAPASDHPDSITVMIMNGTTIVDQMTVTAADNWHYSVMLPETDANGNIINYTVDEGNVPHYTHKVNGYDLLNTYVSATYPGDTPATSSAILSGHAPLTSSTPLTGDSIAPLLLAAIVVLCVAGLAAFGLAMRLRSKKKDQK